MAPTPSQLYETFGDSVTFPIDPATGAVRPGAQSLVKGDWARPVPWVVTLGQPARFSNTGNPIAPPRGIYFDHGAMFAIVEWGFGGTNFAAEVDWRNGCAFGVTGTYVRVTAVFPDDLVVGPDSSGGGITVAAAAVPEATCARPSATRTVQYGTLGPSDNQARYVPAFAVDYMVKNQGIATTTWFTQFLAGNVGPVATAQDFFTASPNRNIGDSSLWLPVAFDANWLDILNTSLNSEDGWRAIYRLGLG
jgi:hypothetical protein